jgi:hypothetical protein
VALAGRDAKHFHGLQQLKYDRCLHPSMDCEAKPIRAHSVQNRRVLDLIHTDGHVIMPRVKLSNDKPPMFEFSKIGRNDATTFTGLCGPHDAAMFKEIDTELLDVTNDKHLKQLAYRSVMKELHTRLEGSSRIHAVYEDLVKRGIIKPEDKSPALLATVAADEGSWRVYRYRAKYFDKETPLEHKIIELNDQPPVIAASAFFPVGRTTEGDFIGPTFNIAPLDEKKSTAVISYPKDQGDAVRDALKPVFEVSGGREKLELSKLIIQRLENFVLSPKWFDSWSEDKRKRIAAEIQHTDLRPLEDHPDLMLF